MVTRRADPWNPQPRQAKAALSAGRRVFVNCPGVSQGVALIDDEGKSVARLADGAEVEILAWRPRGSGTRYRVQSTRDHAEGWLAADELRAARHPALPTLPEAAPRREAPSVDRRDMPRKFGQRR
jgi:hypothetical protein